MTDEAEKPAETIIESVAPKRRSRVKPLLLVGFFVIAWIFAAQVIPRLMPQIINPAPVEQSATAAPPVQEQTAIPLPEAADGTTVTHDTLRLQSELEALRKRVAGLEEKLASLPASAPAATLPADLADRLATLETRINNRSGTTDESALLDVRNRLQAGERELQELRLATRSAQSADWRKLGMISALHSLQEVSASSHPFQRELDNLRTMADGEPAVLDMIDGLQPLATQGVATHEKLRSSFAPAAAQALNQPRNGNAIGDKISTQLSRLVSIRKVGDQPGSSDEAIIARAEARLSQEALDEALKELQTLTPATAQALAPWLAQANQRVALQVQLGELKRAVTQTIHRLATETTTTP